mgnify:CR=1 FL=1
MSQWKFSLYFMGTVPDGVTLPEDRSSKAAQDLCFRWKGVLLELTQCVSQWWSWSRAVCLARRVKYLCLPCAARVARAVLCCAVLCLQQLWHRGHGRGGVREWKRGAQPWLWYALFVCVWWGSSVVVNSSTRFRTCCGHVQGRVRGV